ncbi:MAG: hypothetical protein K6E28_07245, partial [Eubacterium sp.]|nr:hypothetical protein [Eubacterium sp.]
MKKFFSFLTLLLYHSFSNTADILYGRKVYCMINGKKIIALCTSRVYDVLVYGFIKKLNETLQKENAYLLIFAINSDIYWDESAVCAETYVYDIMPYNRGSSRQAATYDGRIQGQSIFYP